MNYFVTSEQYIKDKYDVDVVKDILLDREDRAILLMDATNKTDVLFHLLSGSLSTLGLNDDKKTMKFDDFYLLIDYDNKYAQISSKKEYKRYIDSELFRFAGTSDVTFPIISSFGRFWLRFVIYPIRNKTDLFSVFVYNLTELMNKEELNYERTHKDSLTGLFNQYTFDYHYGLRYQNENFHVMYLDLDDFKEINDRYGHLVGNDFLKAFGQVLKSQECELNHFYRIGGDEFVGLLFLPEQDVKQMAQTIINRTKEIMFKGIQSKISVSIGVSKYVDQIDPVRKADELLYEVKSKGKNDYLFG